MITAQCGRLRHEGIVVVTNIVALVTGAQIVITVGGVVQDHHHMVGMDATVAVAL